MKKNVKVFIKNSNVACRESATHILVYSTRAATATRFKSKSKFASTATAGTKEGIILNYYPNTFENRLLLLRKFCIMILSDFLLL